MEKTNVLLTILALGLVLTSAILAFNMKATTIIREPSVEGAEQVITVSANSEVTVMPDQAEVFLRITTEGETAIEAQDGNKEASNSVIRALEAKGVNEDDLETTQYYISPRYTYDSRTGESRENGYQVFHVVKLTSRDINEVGELTDTAVSAGANGIDNIQFTLSERKEKEVRKEALGEAAVQAREKAEAIASSLNVNLGEIVSVTESSFSYVPLYAERAVAMDASMGGKEAPTEIRPENLEVTATVSVAYAIE